MHLVEIPGLEIGELLLHDAETQLHRAHEPATGRDLLVRVAAVDADPERGQRALRRELRLRGRLEGDGLLLPDGHLGSGASLALRYDRAQASPAPVSTVVGVSLQEALRVVVQATEGLQTLHDAGLVHAQVGPAALLDTPDGVLVAGLGRFVHEGRPADGELPLSRLPWASPEETGRVAWPMTPASDLYSLGVALYRMLAGRLPLGSTDTVGWIHAQVAQPSRPLAQVAPHLPQALTAILERLLAKEPARRYRTGHGLRHDLRAVQGGAIQVQLGTRDLPDKVLPPRRLQGREAELGRILSWCQAATSRLVLLSAEAGMGKTALARELAARLEDAWVCRTQSPRGTRGAPLSVLGRALDDLCERLLSAPGEVGTRTASQVQPLGRAVVEIAPSARVILGEQPPLPALDPAAHRQRLWRALLSFLGAVGTPGNPLVVLLDDAQWADRASLELLAEVLHVQDQGLVVVALHRPVDEAHPLQTLASTCTRDGTPVHRLGLAPLGPQVMGEIVDEVLAGRVEDAQALARHLATETAGNPFVAQQLLRQAHEQGCLVLDRSEGAWRWDQGRWAPRGGSAPTHHPLDDRLATLEPACKRVLGWAAHAGRQVPLDLLAEALGQSPLALLSCLDGAQHAGLLLVEQGGGGSVLSFEHDRIAEACLHLIPPEERPQVHKSLGDSLVHAWSERPSAELAHQAAYHLVQALEGGEELPPSAVQPLLEAGRGAMATADWEEARTPLRAAWSLLPADRWSRPGLARQVGLALAEVEFLCAGAERALELVDEVGAHTLPGLDSVGLARLRIAILTTSMRTREAIDEGLRTLSHLGVEVPLEPEALPQLLGAVAAALGGRTPTQVAQGGQTRDPRVLAAVSLAVELVPVVYMARPELFAPLTCRAMELVAGHGTCPAASSVLACYGIVLGAVGQPQAGYAMARAGHELVWDSPADPGAALTLVQYPVMVQHHHEPVAEVLPLLESGQRLALDLGSLPTWGYCTNQRYLFALLSGVDLAALDERADAIVADLQRAGQVLGAQVAALVGQVVHDLRAGQHPSRWLAGPRFDAEAAVAAFEAQGWSTGVHYARVMEAWLALLYGEPEAALCSMHLAAPHAAANTGHYVLALGETVQAVAALQSARRLRVEDREALVAEVEPLLEALRLRAELCPANHAHRVQWILSQQAWLGGDAEGGLALAEEAVQLALSGGHRADAARILEQCGAACLEQGQVAEGSRHLLRAAELYGAWGATAKRLDFARRYATLRSETGQTAHGSFLPELRHVQAVLAGLEAERSSTRLIQALLGACVEVSGARRGMVLDAQDRVLASSEPGAEIVPSLGICRTARRGGEPVVVQNSHTNARFATDPILADQSPRAVFALSTRVTPAQGLVVYLENDLGTSVFGPHQVSLTRLLVDAVGGLLASSELEARLATTSHQLRSATAEVRTREVALRRAVDDATTDLARLARVHEAVLASMYEGLCVVDPQGLITFANQAAQQVTGWSADQLVGRPLHGTLHQGPDTCGLCALDEGGLSGLEVEFTRPDGSTFPVDLSRQPLSTGEEGVGGAVFTFSDASERHRLQDRLVQVQKMEALGRFAGGLAHQLNNLLTPVVASVDLLSDASGLSAFHRSMVDNMGVAAERAVELIRQTLAFGRQSDLFRQEVELREVLSEVGAFIEPTLHSSIQAHIDLTRQPCPVRADRGQVQQVLLNLAMNAQEALLEGPVAGGQPAIGVRLEREVVSAEQIPADAEARPGVYAVISVTDNGPGMAPEVARRVFEPFFSTREAMVHTGLGLAAVYGIARSHGGWVGCRTSPGQGARFSWYIPLDGSSAAEEQPPTQAPVKKVLVVDDEPLVYLVAQHLLESMGYQAEVAPTGAEALGLYQIMGSQLDLVLLDLSLPDMHGSEVLRRLQALDPEVRVILCSGYSDPAARRTWEARGHPFLGKPFRLAELRQAIDTLLAPTGG